MWSNVLMYIVPKLSSLYTSTQTLPPQAVSNYYDWILAHAMGRTLTQQHRGIKKSFCNGVMSFCNRIAAATAATAAAAKQCKATSNRTKEDNAVADADFFVDDTGGGSQNKEQSRNPLMSPPMLSASNDLLLILFERIKSNHSTSSNIVHPEEIQVMIRACVAHKDSGPRNQCVSTTYPAVVVHVWSLLLSHIFSSLLFSQVHLLIALWKHPNSSVRHAALKGFALLCKMELPEILSFSGIGGHSSSSDTSSSTLVVKINQRLQERDCDEEDRQLLNVLLAWYYRCVSN